MVTKQGVFELIKQGYDPRELGSNGGKKAAAKRKEKGAWKRKWQQEAQKLSEMWWNK